MPSTTSGLLAFDGAGTAVGWARLTPRAEVAWLNHNRVLAAVDHLPVWSLPASTFVDIGDGA